MKNLSSVVDFSTAFPKFGGRERATNSYHQSQGQTGEPEDTRLPSGAGMKIKELFRRWKIRRALNLMAQTWDEPEVTRGLLVLCGVVSAKNNFLILPIELVQRLNDIAAHTAVLHQSYPQNLTQFQEEHHILAGLLSAHFDRDFGSFTQ